MIKFMWNGKSYQVGPEAYDREVVVLPDKTVLNMGRWGETLPPQPFDITEVEHSHSLANSAAELAVLVNGVVAEEVTD